MLMTAPSQRRRRTAIFHNNSSNDNNMAANSGIELRIPWRSILLLAATACLMWSNNAGVTNAQDYDDPSSSSAATTLPKEANSCNGIFLTYSLVSREKELPHVKNVTAQAWAFKSSATVLNAGSTELKSWKIFIGFQHREILVSASGAILVGTDDFPAPVGNGTFLAGYPQADLKTAIDTAGDMTQMEVKIDIKGTQFGIKPPGVPMPKTIRLENDGYKCPAPTLKKSSMHTCCVPDPKFKLKKANATKYQRRQDGDLSLTYDILQSYGGNYQAQVTMDNNHPLGRLDHWNLTWEWMRGEFIQSMRGAYTHRHDPAECLYGTAAQYYSDLDFSTVMSCEKHPVISDLPATRAKDEKVGNLPYCCRNGTLLPKIMDPSKARSIFQLQVYKMPPDLNRTAFTPPQHWKINGVLNPDYKCSAPIRVDASQFPDSSGLEATTSAIASWQVVCNITRPKERQSRCCVSFSAYYNESVVPCNTCACGCDDDDDDGDTTTAGTCNANASPMLLPAEALLVPFANRTAKAVAWAKIKKLPIPKPRPCPDNCGVSLNWHINADYKDGWTARVTLFNWGDVNYEDWFAAFQMNRAYPGYENVYSFNGTRVPEVNNTIFFQGLPGLNYLVGEKNGSDPLHDPRVPGKQQSVVSFKKKLTPGINIVRGDGFPTRVFFDGEECSIPTHIPIGGGSRTRIGLGSLVLLAFTTSWVVLVDRVW